MKKIIKLFELLDEKEIEFNLRSYIIDNKNSFEIILINHTKKFGLFPSLNVLAEKIINYIKEIPCDY